MGSFLCVEKRWKASERKHLIMISFHLIISETKFKGKWKKYTREKEVKDSIFLVSFFVTN